MGVRGDFTGHGDSAGDLKDMASKVEICFKSNW